VFTLIVNGIARYYVTRAERAGAPTTLLPGVTGAE
jgi:hypothetical protein